MKKVLLWVMFITISPDLASAIEVTDYIIDTNIGQFARSYPGGCSEGSGIIMGARHFDLNHNDELCDIRYFDKTVALGVDIQVTQHAGSDSDQWLLHEVEDAFRGNPEQDKFKGVLREINGNRIFTYNLGTHYSWISGNKVVDIRYTDLQKVKPEPLEIVNAYLQKHPSTVPAMVMDTAHDEQWIKDEMARRLWLGDKWFLQIQTGKATQDKVLREALDHMNTFLDYREKYFDVSGLPISTAEEKQILSGFLDSKKGTEIKNKLTEYKAWWEVNKDNAIVLP